MFQDQIMTIYRLSRLFGVASLVALSLSAIASQAFAHDYTIGTLKIGHPWTRATPGGAKVAGGYLTVENTGTTPDRLMGGTMEVSGRVEIHEMSMNDGIMRMRELPQGLDIPPGAKVELKPGSYHVMFMQLQRPLKLDEKVKATLVFEKAGTIEVVFNVESVAARSSGGSEHKH
jgi:periplasmic copper chaperone A